MTPPRLACLLLRIARLGAQRTEIESDLALLFRRRAAIHGTRYARRRYWRDVLSFCLPGREDGRNQASLVAAHMEAGLMSEFWFDLRQALRSTARQPGFFAVATLTLGIGFAAHLTAFTVVDRLMLAAPPHVERPQDVFRLHVDRADIDGGRFLWFQTPYRSYLDLREQARSFAGMAAYRQSRASLGSGAGARMVSVTFADQHYFSLLGVSAQRGRFFRADEDQAPSGTPVLVLSDAFWRGAYGADEGVIGRTERIGSQTFTIIGIAPRGFNGDVVEPIDAWAPLHSAASELPPSWATSLSARTVVVLARLTPGSTRTLAAADAAAAYKRAVDGTPVADPTALVVLASLYPGRAQRGEMTQAAKIALCLEAVSLLVLLVAIANVINLQMSRAAHRRRETAVRVALGAGRGRLLRALVLEMLLMSAAGVGLALAVTWWAAAALQEFLLPGAVSLIDPVRFSMVAAATAAGAVCLLAAFASLQTGDRGIGADLKTGRGGDGFTRARLRQGLLIAQVVMSAVLLVGAGLFLRSAARLTSLEFGIDHERVLAVSLPLRSAGYTPEAIEMFYSRAVEELAGVPGVERVASAQTTPFSPSQMATLSLPGREPLSFGEAGYPTFYTVTPGYFSTVGVRIVRGRAFTDVDRAGAAHVAIVEQALADVLWPGEDPLGKCLIVSEGSTVCREVVGIASNTRRFVGTSTGALRYYLPLGQRLIAAPPQALLVRASGDPRALIESLRGAVLRIDGNLPYVRIQLLRDLAEPEMRPWRLGGILFTAFGAAALTVSTAGVYALLAFIVAYRSREIGVRLALGASPSRTLAMVIGQSLRWIAAGLVAGLAVALAAARYVEPLLFETSPYDVGVFGGTAGVLLTVAVVASLIPAIRASRVDPNIALRAE